MASYPQKAPSCMRQWTSWDFRSTIPCNLKSFSVSQNLEPILQNAFGELAKFVLSYKKLLKSFSCTNNPVKVASLGSCSKQTRLQIAPLVLGPVWVGTEKSWGNRDTSQGQQVPNAGSCIVTRTHPCPSYQCDILTPLNVYQRRQIILNVKFVRMTLVSSWP